MAPIATTISPTSIHMRFADNADPEKAEEWVDFRVPLNALKLADQGGERALGNPDHEYLGVIRRAALQYVQALIAAEIRRL
jgi:hypothetical protein